MSASVLPPSSMGDEGGGHVHQGLGVDVGGPGRLRAIPGRFWPLLQRQRSDTARSTRIQCTEQKHAAQVDLAICSVFVERQRIAPRWFSPPPLLPSFLENAAFSASALRLVVLDRVAAIGERRRALRGSVACVIEAGMPTMVSVRGHAKALRCGPQGARTRRCISMQGQ